MTIKAVLLGILFASVLLCGCNHIGSIHSYVISNTSMEPTIHKGDKILVDESYYSSHPVVDNDLIVFRRDGYVLVKRVSAIAGDTIEGRDGVMFLNGHALTEPYTQHVGQAPAGAQNFAPRVVPPGQVFVTGDNRNYSYDSRFDDYGIVQTSDVMGTLTYLYPAGHLTGRRLP